MATETPSAASPPVLDVTALDRWLAQFKTRDEMAAKYAELLADLGLTWHGFAALNLAIMDRWSEPGLRFIKDKAWRLYLGR